MDEVALAEVVVLNVDVCETKSRINSKGTERYVLGKGESKSPQPPPQRGVPRKASCPAGK